MSWGNELDQRELNEYLSQINVTAGRAMFTLNSNDYFFALNCEQHYLQAYKLCPPLKAIIGKRAKTFNSGTFGIINRSTDKPATGRADLKAILDRPNVLQSGDQFFAQQNSYLDIFGYCPVFSVEPAGMPGTIAAIWNIPPWLFDLNYTRKWLQQFELDGLFKEFFIWWNGEKITLDAKRLKFIFDDGIGTDEDSNLLIPDSRLVGLEYPVSNIVAAYKSRNTLITKRGAIGILSNESTDDSGSKALKPGEKESLQADFKKYGLVGQPFQIIVSESTLKWQQMGYPTSELMLFEEIEDSINRLCDAYGYPSVLLARAQGTTFENQKVARRDLIENSIIPENKSRLQQFTRIIAPDDTVEIVRDYSKLMVFQDDAKNKADARSAIDTAYEKEYNNNLITKNDWLKAIGMPTLGADGDFYKSDAKSSDPLAVRLGVGGTTALITYITNPTLTTEDKVNGLQILFGLSPEDANKMVSEPPEAAPPAQSPIEEPIVVQ